MHDRYDQNTPTHRVFFRQEPAARADRWLEIGFAIERHDGDLVVTIDREPFGGFIYREELVLCLRPWAAGRPETERPDTLNSR